MAAGAKQRPRAGRQFQAKSADAANVMSLTIVPAAQHHAGERAGQLSRAIRATASCGDQLELDGGGIVEVLITTASRTPDRDV
jgi:hypothetical protein